MSELREPIETNLDDIPEIKAGQHTGDPSYLQGGEVGAFEASKLSHINGLPAQERALHFALYALETAGLYKHPGDFDEGIKAAREALDNPNTPDTEKEWHQQQLIRLNRRKAQFQAINGQVRSAQASYESEYTVPKEATAELGSLVTERLVELYDATDTFLDAPALQTLRLFKQAHRSDEQTMTDAERILRIALQKEVDEEA